MEYAHARVIAALNLVVWASLPLTAFGEDGESLTRDAATGDYIIRYFGTGEPRILQTVVWIPATKIEPLVRSRWRLPRHGNMEVVDYSYQILNGHAAKQNVTSVGIQVSELAETESPPGWQGVSAEDVKTPLYNVGWWQIGYPIAGIKPNRMLGGFAVSSPDLPGVGEVQLSGATPPDQSLPDEGPDPMSDVGKAFNAILEKDYVIRYAAVPLIKVPNPYAPASLLAELQKHVDHDLVSMDLIEEPLVARLDPLFESAIAAAQGGNTDALRNDLREIRHLLRDDKRQEKHDEHEDDACEAEDGGNRGRDGRSRSITKLARDVLEFDLRFIERRATSDRAHDRRGVR